MKCSLNGEDPYWGRVVSELGSAGVGFDPDRCRSPTAGCRCAGTAWRRPTTRRRSAAHMAGRHVELHCDLGLGRGSAAVLTTDLGHGYIDENRTTS